MDHHDVEGHIIDTTVVMVEERVQNDAMARQRKRKMCNSEGCQKSAVSKGFCSTHGGGARCMIEDCNKLVTRKGYCSAHATMHGYKSEIIDKRRGRYKRKECKYPECTNMEYGNSKGLCVEHGGGPKRCNAVEGCTRVAIFEGMCIRHANALRALRDGTDMGGLGVVGEGEMADEAAKIKKARTNVKRCKEEGCEKHIVACGYCMAHAREHRDELPEKYICHHKDEGPESSGEICGTVCLRNQRCYQHSEHTRCKIDGCVKHAVFRGYCKSHGKAHEPVTSASIAIATHAETIEGGPMD